MWGIYHGIPHFQIHPNIIWLVRYIIKIIILHHHKRYYSVPITKDMSHPFSVKSHFSMVIHIFCDDFWINNEVSMFHGFYPIKIPKCLWMSMVSIYSFYPSKRSKKIVARFTSAVPWGGFKGSGAEDWPMDGRYAAAGPGPDVEKPLGKAPEGRMEWFMEVNG